MRVENIGKFAEVGHSYFCDPGKRREPLSAIHIREGEGQGFILHVNEVHFHREGDDSGRSPPIRPLPKIRQ